MTRRLTRITLVLTAACLAAPAALGQTLGTCRSPISNAFLDVNNVRAYITNDGNLFQGATGFYEVPVDGGVIALYSAHLLIGGLVNGDLRTSIGRFRGGNSLWAGPVFPGVLPPPDCDRFDRIYKINREDLVAYETEGRATGDLRDWPTGLGAPTLDADGNRIVLQTDGTLAYIDENGIVVDTEVLPLEERIERTINLAAGERPDLLGDQMLWWVMNDLGNSHGYDGSRAIGVEVHATAFGFTVPGVIGNTTFYKFRILYKAEQPFERAYLGLHFDADLGYFGDDYVGVDTTLGLGYAYNADNDDDTSDEGYGTPPPAIGVDFFQGPLADPDGVDNDRDGSVDEPGERLQMTAFQRAINAEPGSYLSDPYDAQTYYYVMQGLWKDGNPVTVGGDGHTLSGERTTFHFSGAAEDGAFWSEINIDGQGTADSPGDKRFNISSGPITLQPGDEQEIVFGIVWSRGADHLDSVRQLKQDDALAQALFDIDFALPAPPAAPRVTATPLDEKVVLEWTYAPTDNNYLDSYYAVDPLLSPDVTDNDYLFEGYKVFQFESPRDQVGKLLATYDVPNGITRVIEGGALTFVTAEGTDSGLQHHHVVDGLTNYQTYFFGVQAYAYNDSSGQKVYAGPVRRVEVVPTRVDNRGGGTLLNADEGDPVGFSLDGGGPRDEDIVVEVVNPDALTGHDYRIDIVDHDGALIFNVVDDETGEMKFDGAEYARLHNRSPLTFFGDIPNAILVDGLSITVVGAVDCTRGIFSDENDLVNTGARPLQREVFLGPIDADPAVPAPGTIVRFYSQTAESRAGLTTFVDSLDTDNDMINDTALFRPEFFGDFDMNGIVDTVRAVTEVAGPDGANLCPEGPNVGGCLNGERIIDAPFFNSTGQWTMPIFFAQSFASLPYFAPRTYELRFIDGMDLTWNVFTTGVLTEVPYQIWDIGDVAPGQANDPQNDQQLVAVQFSDSGGECTWSWAEFDRGDGTGVSDRIYALYTASTATYADYRREAASHLGKPLLNGDSFRIQTADLAPQKQTREALALDQIGIVPNPYKGASAYEVSQQTDEVRFTNMPEQATIRVFNLAGTLVRRMNKNSPDAFFRWNLRTDNDLPIASGIYFIHIDVPGVGERALKFAVVRKGARLNTF